MIEVLEQPTSLELIEERATILEVITPGVQGPPGASGGNVIDGDTQLVNGRSYIDVVFPSPQLDDTWKFVDLIILNTVDPQPRNIWPGIVTGKTKDGFRLQLNGQANSDNYYLHWAITAIELVLTPATTYFLTGPTAGVVGVAKTYTVALPTGTTVDGLVTVTPSDSGGGGLFAPTSAVLSDDTPNATFTYTPATIGVKTISVANDAGLTNPNNITFNATEFSTTYLLVGPISGVINVPSTDFTVELPVDGSLNGPVVVTPSDGGAGGVFTPSTVTLSNATPAVTFTYTPSTYGARTISVTNNGGLTDPASMSYTSIAHNYLLSGPSGGEIGTPSTNFTVALPAGGVVLGAVTITPNDSSGGGTFTPSTVNLTTAAPSATFTYTAASAGLKTIGATNNVGLNDPASLGYTAVIPAIGDGDPVITWPDSSGLGNIGLRVGVPIFKESIVNGKPVVRVAAGAGFTLTTPVSGEPVWAAIGVMRAAALKNLSMVAGTDPSGSPLLAILTESPNNYFFLSVRDAYRISDPPTDGNFHVFRGVFAYYTGGGLEIRIDGASPVSTYGPQTVGGNISRIAEGDGDVAEIVILQGGSELFSGVMADIEKTLQVKYATPTVPAGSVINIATAVGLKGWWKADAIT